MSRLVGSAWGLAGIGFTSLNVHRRAQSAAMAPVRPALSPLPPILLGKGPIDRMVPDPNVTTSRLGAGSNGSRRHLPASELPPANSTMRITGSKSGRALDHLDEKIGSPADIHVKVEERPKKKRRSGGNEQTVRPLVPSPPSARVTRAMTVRQFEVDATTPTRVTRSTSKRLAALTNTPTRGSYDGAARRSKSLKRL
ncbi:hypothetical protein FRC06_011025 [Ceratobasidium sp. 370]|nr:hypothetical protein FRC06_011025 [Ceratobasidium sp. 370]